MMDKMNGRVQVLNGCVFFSMGVSFSLQIAAAQWNTHRLFEREAVANQTLFFLAMDKMGAAIILS